MKFSIKAFFSKCDQIRNFLRIWPYLLKKSLMENFIFCEVYFQRNNSDTTQRTQTSLRRLQGVLKRSRRLTIKQDIVTTSGKRRLIYDVLKMSDSRRLQDVWLTTSWRRLIYVILKTSNFGRLENVWFTTFSGRLIYDVLKTSNLRRLEEIWFMTSWRRRFMTF